MKKRTINEITREVFALLNELREHAKEKPASKNHIEDAAEKLSLSLNSLHLVE